MVTTKRSHHNPILIPEPDHNWEAMAAFNGSIVKDETNYTMVYRALSIQQLFLGIRMNVSSVGLAQSGDGIHFQLRDQFIAPTELWDQFGCEDPRITKLDDTYYIFYTAISTWPPDAGGIKVAMATTQDLKTIKEKHPVTFFNAKAAVMFPERINGKIAVALTAHTDLPPSKICLALFDDPKDIWSQEYWRKWYAECDKHIIPIHKTEKDQVEIGAVPVKTEKGWVMLVGYVQDYFTDKKVFRIDAVLLDLDNPQKVIGQTVDPLLVPQEEYEIYGMVPNTIFPSGAMIENGQFYIYYGAADTTVARANIAVHDLLDELTHNPNFNKGVSRLHQMERYNGNPIISPIHEHDWESKYTFNAGAIYAEGKAHILYRAQGELETSVLGYANSINGLHIDERFDKPVYVPREPFEIMEGKGFSGCEDPRITIMGDTIYMCYTAYDGRNPPRVALATIKYEDFVAHRWNWTKPKLISAPHVDNKDSCILSEKIDNMYVIFHRLPPCIWVDLVSDLEHLGTERNTWIGGRPLFGPRVGMWDNLKIGLNGPPEKTEDGWLLFYHGVSKNDDMYRLGVALLDLENPLKVLARLHNPILEPQEWYENEGYRKGTVFSNGQVIINDELFVYYGGADKYLAVAHMPVKKLLEALKKGK